MKYINTELLNRVTAEAKNSSRKRMNYNFHKNGEELLQRVLTPDILEFYSIF
ncbi:hypothetical protein [Labilibaculum euxinus]